MTASNTEIKWALVTAKHRAQSENRPMAIQRSKYGVYSVTSLLSGDSSGDKVVHEVWCNGEVKSPGATHRAEQNRKDAAFAAEVIRNQKGY